MASLWRDLLERLSRMIAGYVHLSEAEEGKCTTEMSFRQYVDVGFLETPML